MDVISDSGTLQCMRAYLSNRALSASMALIWPPHLDTVPGSDCGGIIWAVELLPIPVRTADTTTAFFTWTGLPSP